MPGAPSQSWSPGEAEGSQTVSSCSVCDERRLSNHNGRRERRSGRDGWE